MQTRRFLYPYVRTCDTSFSFNSFKAFLVRYFVCSSHSKAARSSTLFVVPLSMSHITLSCSSCCERIKTPSLDRQGALEMFRMNHLTRERSRGISGRDLVIYYTARADTGVCLFVVSRRETRRVPLGFRRGAERQQSTRANFAAATR